jgi:zinc protease
MMFKGTDRFKKGEIDLITQRAGGFNNAFCAEDVTGYHFTLPSSGWLVPLEIEASRMRGCRLDSAEFEAERRVVLSELAEALDSPEEALYDAVNLALFEGHPYSAPILGSKESLSTLSVEKMRDFYDCNYSPKNAILVVVGDADAKAVLEKARELFEEMESPEKTAPRLPSVSVEMPADLRVSIKFNTSVPQILIAFRTTPIANVEEAFALEAVAAILAIGKTSRLYRRLIERDALASTVSILNDTRLLGGAFYISAKLQPEATLDAVEKAILSELERFARDGPSDMELQKAKNTLSLSFRRQQQYSMEIAQNLGKHAAAGLPEFWRQYEEQLEALDSEDLLEVARKYFTPKNRVIGRLQPEEEGETEEGEEDEEEQGYRGAEMESPGKYQIPNPKFQLRRADFQAMGRGCRRSLPEPPGPDLRLAFELPDFVGVWDLGFGISLVPELQVRMPELWQVQIENGLVVLVARRPSSPIVSVRFDVDVRHEDDPPGKAGLGNLVGELLDAGTANRTGGEILGPIEQLGSTLECSARGISLDVLPGDLNAALEVMVDVVANASFPEDSIELIKNKVAGEITSAEEDPATYALQLLHAAVYKGHPYEYPVTGTRETLASVTRGDIVAHHSRFFRPNNTIVTVVGDVEPAKVVEELRHLTAGWESKPVTREELRALMLQEEGQQVFEYRDLAQLYITLGHLGVTRDNPDYHALLVMDQILGGGAGFTDRLQRHLRDEEGLAYIVNAGITDSVGRLPGVFAAFIGTAVENKDRAIAGIKREIVAMCSAPPTSVELADAKRYLIGKHVIGLEGNRDLADLLVMQERYGLGKDYISRFPELVEAVTVDDVHRAAQKWLKPDALSLVVVGHVDDEGNVVNEEAD